MCIDKILDFHLFQHPRSARFAHLPHHFWFSMMARSLNDLQVGVTSIGPLPSFSFAVESGVPLPCCELALCTEEVQRLTSNIIGKVFA